MHGALGALGNVTLVITSSTIMRAVPTLIKNEGAHIYPIIRTFSLPGTQ